MKAIMYTEYGAPEVLRLKEIPRPSPGDQEILIRIRAAGINATDPICRAGKPYVVRLDTGFFRPNKPILGTSLAGEVEAVGKKVKRFREGDRVFGSSGPGMGAHAEYICLPESAALIHIPSEMSDVEAVAIPYGGLTALPFLRDAAQLQEGQDILINGASGGVGIFAVQLAKYYGANVTAVCSRKHVDMMQSLGAEAVIAHETEDFTAIGQSWDVIFDAAGLRSYAACKQALRPGGKYLTTVPTLRIMLQMLRSKLFGSKKAGIAFTGLRSPEKKGKDLKILTDLCLSGVIRPIIDREFPLEKMAEAHHYAENRYARGKIVISFPSII